MLVVILALAIGGFVALAVAGLLQGLTTALFHDDPMPLATRWASAFGSWYEAEADRMQPALRSYELLYQPLGGGSRVELAERLAR